MDKAKMGKSKCLICLFQLEEGLKEPIEKINSSCFFNCEDDKNLSKELEVIFIVRSVLNIPSTLCEEFVAKVGNPSSWGVNLCRLCQLIVREAQFTLSRIKTLAKEYADLRVTLKGRLVLDDQDLNTAEDYAKSRASTSRYKLKKPEIAEFCLSSRIRQHLLQKNLAGQKNAEKTKRASPKTEPDVKVTPKVPKIAVNVSKNSPNGRKRKKKWNTSSSLKKRFKPARSKLTKPKPTGDLPPHDKEIVIKDVHTLKDTEMGGVKTEPNDNNDNDDTGEDYQELCFPFDEDPGEIDEYAGDFGIDDNDQDPMDEFVVPKPIRRSSRPQRKIQKNLIADKDEGSECDSENLELANDDAEEIDDWNLDGSEASEEDEDPDYDDGIRNRPKRSVSNKKEKARTTSNNDDDDGVAVKKERKWLHQCPHCPSCLQNAIVCEAHVLRVHKGIKNAYQCDVCSLSFDKFARVLCHIDQKHPDEIKISDNPLPISKVDENDPAAAKIAHDENFFYIFEEREVDEADVEANEKPEEDAVKPSKPRRRDKGEDVGALECEQCSYTFSMAHLLRSHILRCHYGDKQPYQCDICLRRFNRKIIMTRHREQIHPECTTPYEGPKIPIEDRIAELEQKNKNFPPKNKFISTDPKKKYHCKVCDVSFNNRVVAEVHLKRVHEDSTSKFPCFHCDLKFLTEPGRRIHTADIHTNPMRRRGKIGYTHCGECDLPFKSALGLQQHERRLHGREKTFLCELCSIVCADKANLLNHQRQYHWEELGLEPVKCNVCGRHLWSKRNLRVHMILAHTKDYPYKCSQCTSGKVGFATESQLERHVAVVHRNEKRYKCPFPTCGKLFSQTGNMNIHYRIHTGEKPYKCQHCGRAYSDPPTFKRHLQTHGTKIHVCPVPSCGKEFKVWHAFRIHCKKHDGTLPKRKPATRRKRRANVNNDDTSNSATSNNDDNSNSAQGQDGDITDTSNQPSTSTSNPGGGGMDLSTLGFYPLFNTQPQQPFDMPQLQPEPSQQQQPQHPLSISLSMPKINF